MAKTVEKRPVFRYQAFKHFRVIDGDTVCCDIDFGLDTIRKNVRVRLNRTDAPEQKYQCGVMVTKIICALIHRSKTLEIVSESVMEGRGRLMGDVIIDEGSLGQILLDHGLAKPCSGKRPEWSQDELVQCLEWAYQFVKNANLDLSLPLVIIDGWR